MRLQFGYSTVYLATLAAAHFSIEYPEWRGDSFAVGASQYTYPCANLNQTASTKRTIWPLTGGSLTLDLHHPWTYIMVNLGLGTDYPVFNISLTQNFLNETGNGTLCIPQLVLPANVKPVDGQNASIQVVTFGSTGASLYNCADVSFSSKATVLTGNNCTTSPNVVISAVTQEFNGSTTSTSANSTITKPSLGLSLKETSMVPTTLAVAMAAVVMGFLL